MALPCFTYLSGPFCNILRLLITDPCPGGFDRFLHPVTEQSILDLATVKFGRKITNEAYCRAYYSFCAVYIDQSGMEESENGWNIW